MKQVAMKITFLSCSDSYFSHWGSFEYVNSQVVSPTTWFKSSDSMDLPAMVYYVSPVTRSTLVTHIPGMIIYTYVPLPERFSSNKMKHLDHST